LSTTVEAQITETVQKLLPATVAVELKSVRAAAKTDDQSLYKALAPIRRVAQPIELGAAAQLFKLTQATYEQLQAKAQAAQKKQDAEPKRKAAVEASKRAQALDKQLTAASESSQKQLKTVQELSSQIQAVSQLYQQKQLEATKSLEQQHQAAAQLAKQLAQQQSKAAAKKIDAISYATGTVVSADGLIITMLGSESGRFKVTLNNGKELPARLLAVDRRSGLQLLKIDAQDLPHVKLFVGDVLLGGQVATVMCTDVSERAAATGIITAKGRSISNLSVEVLQTDLQIGPMSAGAPLANLRGELIGIFVAEKDDGAGLSFAVPSKYVRELLESGARDEAIVLERGFLGVQLDGKDETPYISQVIEDSPAEKAGFKKGDSIVKIDGEFTSTSGRVVRAIGRHKAGDKITITSTRNGETREFVVTLGTFPKANIASSATLENAHPAIQFWHPGQIVVAGEDGKIKVWTPDVTVTEFPY